jgi:hypothetical protein
MTDNISVERFEQQIQALAAGFSYPPTPDMATRTRQPLRRPVRRPRLAWALAIVLVIAAGLLAVPSVRAAVVEIVKLGAVRIFIGGPTPTPLPPTGQLSLSELPGETTLEVARASAAIPIRLPSYPPDLGPPDRVFLLRQFGGTIILVWEDPNYPDLARLALFEIPPGPIVNKLFPERIESTSVAGRPAIWTTGDHFVEVIVEGQREQVLVRGNVLIWSLAGVTYRLETTLALEEAIRIAESIEEPNPPEFAPVTAEPLP